MANSSMIVAWRSGATSRYESLWALIHKFAHLNGAGFSEIKAMFDATPWVPWYQGAGALDRLERLDSKKLAQAFEIPEPDIRLLVSEAYNVGSETSTALRYCPVCIKKGFHTAAFQLNSIKKCPLHKVDLQYRCPGCHSSILYGLGVKELSTPFGCRCGTVLWPGITSDIWPRALTLEEEGVFERLLRWVDTIKGSDSLRQHGKWYDDSIYEKNMRGLACLEEVEGWAAECFGADRRNVIEAEYDGQWTRTSKRRQSAIPINVGHGGPCGGDKAFEDWFNKNLLHAYWQRAETVVSTVEKCLGRHRKCADGVALYRSGTVSRNGFCLLGIAYTEWVDSLSRGHWVNSECYYRNFGRDSLDPAWGIQSALTAIEGRSDPMGRTLKPLVLWLALEIFEARLLCNFASFVEQAILELSYRREDGRFKGKLGRFPKLKELDAVIAYYPGGIRRPRVKSYLGFSLQELAEFSRSGVGCEL